MQTQILPSSPSTVNPQEVDVITLKALIFAMKCEIDTARKNLKGLAYNPETHQALVNAGLLLLDMHAELDTEDDVLHEIHEVKAQIQSKLKRPSDEAIARAKRLSGRTEGK